jgi:hypothetical protein
MDRIDLPSSRDALTCAEAAILSLRGAEAASTPSSSRLQPNNPCFSLRSPRPNRTKDGEILRTAHPNPHRARASSRGSDFQLSWTPAFRVNPPVSPGGRPRNLEDCGHFLEPSFTRSKASVNQVACRRRSNFSPFPKMPCHWVAEVEVTRGWIAEPPQLREGSECQIVFGGSHSASVPALGSIFIGKAST